MAKAVEFTKKLKMLVAQHRKLVGRRNPVDKAWYNGLYDRYKYPVITADHLPLTWRYDLNPKTNPHLIERLGVNTTLNAGAIELNGTVCLMVRVEGADRKSFFAVAESRNGIDNFRFRDYPVLMPETDDPDTNIYDMRLTAHEDGWIYGLFCTERKDPNAPPGDMSSAVAKCAIARTKDLQKWQRLADLKTNSAHQRNVVLHPEFVGGKYALYTRPQDGCVDVGKGGGIGFTLTDDITKAVVGQETIIDPKVYHTIKETKNGAGAPPVKTNQGWLHVAHGVRNTAAGMRYVLYSFLCDLNQHAKIIRQPGGHLIAPLGEERVGDVSNVVFCNGMVARKNGQLFIYYASSDTRIHLATTTIEKMLDYVNNTPADPLRSYECTRQRIKLIEANLAMLKTTKDPVLKSLRK